MLPIDDLLIVLKKSVDVINCSYNILRKPAKEVLVTVLSDLERQGSGDDSIAHAVPIHYGLSGFSLPMKSVRQILSEIVGAIQERQLDTKAIAFDGQFLELAVADDNGRPLTVLKFMKQFWEEVKSTNKISKRDTLLKLYDMPAIKNVDDVMNIFNCHRYSTRIVLSLKNSVKVRSVGSPRNIALAFEPRSKSQAGSSLDDEEESSGDTCPEYDLLQYLPNEIVSSLDIESIDILKQVGKSVSSKGDEETKIQEVQDIQHALGDEDYELALISLIADGRTKFDSCSLEEFKGYFSSAKKISQTFTVSELKLMTSLLANVKCNNSALKPELVNMISTWYGNGDTLIDPVRSPKRLKVLVSNHIKSWPIDALNVAYAQLNFIDAFHKWSNENTFNGSWNIQTEEGKTFLISQWYAQPALVNGSLIQPIIDPHHIFVNNRSRCCSKGMLGMGITPEAWWRVAKNSKENNTGLSWEIAKELRDRQSNSFAQTTFSEKVEKVMATNGDKNEANWCCLIRNWYSAIDDAGISVGTRLTEMLTIRSYLLSFLKAGHFPPCGSYISGMPIAQFEGILTNVDRRIQLYAMVKRKTYNQRAITSLDSETFFSGFQVCALLFIEKG